MCAGGGNETRRSRAGAGRCAAAVRRIRDGQAAARGRHGSAAATPVTTALPGAHGKDRQGRGLVRWRHARGCRGPGGVGLRYRPRPSALAVPSAQWRRARGREQLAETPPGRRGRLGRTEGNGLRGSRRAQRQPSDLAARCRRRRPRRGARGVRPGAELALGHGAGGRHPVRGLHRRAWWPCPTSLAPRARAARP